MRQLGGCFGKEERGGGMMEMAGKRGGIVSGNGKEAS